MQKGYDIWLVLDSRSFGGIEAHVLQLAKLIHALGMTACVVRLKHYGDHPMDKQLQNHNIPYFTLERGWRQLLAGVNTLKPKLLHSHGYKAGIYSRLISLITSNKVIHTHHAGEKCTGKLAFYAAFDRYSSILNHKNIAVSQAIQNRLPVRSERFNNFIDMEGIAPSSGKNIAFVGRLSHEKGPDRFVQLAKQFPDSHFHLYGEGPMRQELEKKSTENCVFHGMSNMENTWSDIGLLIVSSRQEGLPLAAIEAMARGIPVLSFAVGDMANLITHQENGLISQAQSVERLCIMLHTWLSLSDQQKRQMRGNAIKRIKNEFSLKSQKNRYRNAYHALGIQSKAAPTPILIPHFGEEWIRGSEKCLIELCRNLDRSRWQPIVWTNVKSLVEPLSKINVKVEIDKFTILAGWQAPKLNIVNYFRLRNKTKLMIQRYGIKVIHCNNAAPNQWVIPVAKKMSIPVACQLHAPYQFRDRLSLLLHEVDLLIGVSEAVMKPLLKTPNFSQQYRVIPNGIDQRSCDSIEAGSLQRELKIEKNSAIILSVGSLIKRKGHDLLIYAMTHFKTKNGPHLVIVGGGEEFQSLNDLANELNVSDRVHFLGERGDIQNIMSSGVTLFASAARDEAFGLVLAEAGLAHLPVVATNVGGIPEVLDKGVCGVLVKPESVLDMVVGIRAVLDNREFAEDISEKLHRRVMQEYHSATNAHRICQEYERLIVRETSPVRFFDCVLIWRVLTNLTRKICGRMEHSV